jgi:hypothetical protein
MRFIKNIRKKESEICHEEKRAVMKKIGEVISGMSFF